MLYSIQITVNGNVRRFAAATLHHVGHYCLILFCDDGFYWFDGQSGVLVISISVVPIQAPDKANCKQMDGSIGVSLIIF